MCLILNHLLFAFKYTFLYLAQEMVQSQEFFLVVTSPPIFSTKILDGGNSTEFLDRAPWGGGLRRRQAGGRDLLWLQAATNLAPSPPTGRPRGPRRCGPPQPRTSAVVKRTAVIESSVRPLLGSTY